MSDINNGFLSENQQMMHMVVLDYVELAKRCEGYRAIKCRVGLTMGSFDVKNVGHDRYFMFAKQYCDVLIVGVRSDQEISRRKGIPRPVVLEEERLEQVCHTRWVDVATFDMHDSPPFALHKAVRPDTLIISTQTIEGVDVPEYSLQEIEELKKYCGEIVVVNRQAQTSATARIRTAMLGLSDHLSTELSKQLAEQIPKDVHRITANFFHQE